MLRADPVALVRQQLAADRRRCAAYAGLFEHKLARMRASPLAFLRGAAPAFYQVLKDNPDFAQGPRGGGWIAGDLHLENFGAYRPSSLLDEKGGSAKAGLAVFDLNDFDDAIQGPFYLDVLRLTTSLLLGARELRAGGTQVIELAEELLAAHSSHAFAARKLPAEPRPVGALLAAVRARTRVVLLDARTRLAHGERALTRGARYRELPGALGKSARAAFHAYAESLQRNQGVLADHLEIIDLAFRVAGTGSLGGLRIAVLVRGKGGPNGAWLFDMKEEGRPSAALLLGAPEMKPAERVQAALAACVRNPPRMLGTTKLDGRSMFVRRLAPQEDKLDLTRLHPRDLGPLARYLGALTGAAHRRGASHKRSAPWTREDRRIILDRAIAMAGLHEAAYLALCAPSVA